MVSASKIPRLTRHYSMAFIRAKNCSRNVERSNSPKIWLLMLDSASCAGNRKHIRVVLVSNYTSTNFELH